MVIIRKFIKNGKTFTVAELGEGQITSNGKFVLYRGKTTNITKFIGIYRTVPLLMEAMERISLKEQKKKKR